MDDIWMRFVEDLIDRVSGPMKFRLVLQPVMATFFAVRSGLEYARAGKPPYFWSLLHDPAHRTEMLENGWKSVGKVLVFALVLDVVYQFIVLRFVYPGEAIDVCSGDPALPDSAGLVTRVTSKK